MPCRISLNGNHLKVIYSFDREKKRSHLLQMIEGQKGQIFITGSKYTTAATSQPDPISFSASPSPFAKLEKSCCYLSLYKSTSPSSKASSSEIVWNNLCLWFLSDQQSNNKHGVFCLQIHLCSLQNEFLGCVGRLLDFFLLYNFNRLLLILLITCNCLLGSVSSSQREILSII